MWIFTKFGFFSIVEKPEDEKENTLTVRARVKTDLESLRDEYLPILGPISEDKGTDYKYRARAPRLDIASAFSQIVLDIDYSNFKEAVAKNQGTERASSYHEIWGALHGLQAKKVSELSSGQSTKMSYGGVLLNCDRQVLLRRPKGDFDGYVWTFPKGNEETNSTPEQTALRRVKQKTGYAVEIVGKLPGKFDGGTGTTEYFLMRTIGEPERFDHAETESITWISLDEAQSHIKLSQNVIGRLRDLSVLEAVNRYVREHATRFSWQNFDLPARNARLAFKMRFSPGEVARLRKGNIPCEMEDKWFIFFENNWLNFHRSWTGFCIYRLRLEPDGECYRVAEALVNRDPEQYTETRLAADKKLILALLYYRFAIGSEPHAN